MYLQRVTLLSAASVKGEVLLADISDLTVIVHLIPSRQPRGGLQACLVRNQIQNLAAETGAAAQIDNIRRGDEAAC